MSAMSTCAALTSAELKTLQQIELRALREIDRICKKRGISYSLAYGTLIGAVRHQGFIPWDDDIDVMMLRPDYECFKEACKTDLNQSFFYQCNETDTGYFHLFDKIRVNGTVFRESFLADKDIHHGVYVDIFPVDGLPEGRVAKAVQYVTFHFFRTGLMCKYGSLASRSGKKRFAASVLRLVYAPFTLEGLYKKALNIARRYDSSTASHVRSFLSPYKRNDSFPKSIFEKCEVIKFEDTELLAVSRFDEVLTKLYGKYMQLPPEPLRKPRHDLVELDLGETE